MEAWVRPDAREWVEEALRDDATLHQAAARQSSGPRMVGRAPLHLVQPRSGTRWVVRHYVRGGFFGPVLGDRFLCVGTPRPFGELQASEQARATGVKTPAVLAAAVYRDGPMYRGDIVTEYVEARDLAELLFGNDGTNDPELRRTALGTAGTLVRELARAAVRHRDLNAKNILVSEGAGPMELHVLDLDRAEVGGVASPENAERMLLRLERSLRKWERISGRGMEPAEWEALRSGAGAGGPPSDGRGPVSGGDAGPGRSG